MAQALVIPLIEQGLIPAGEVIAVVGRQDSVATVSARVPSDVKVVAASDPAAKEAWGASVQLLAVKPQMLDAVAASCNSLACAGFKPFDLCACRGSLGAASNIISWPDLCACRAQYPLPGGSGSHGLGLGEWNL